MHESYELHPNHGYEVVQLPDDIPEITIEVEHDVSLPAVTEEVIDTSVIGAPEDRTSVTSIEGAFIMPQTTSEDDVPVPLQPALDVPNDEPRILEQATDEVISLDDSSHVPEEFDDSGIVAETPLHKEAAQGSFDSPERLEADTEELDSHSELKADHTKELEAEDKPEPAADEIPQGDKGTEVRTEVAGVHEGTEQRADAVLAVVDEVTQGYLDEQGMRFVHDRSGIFVPARAENVLTCLRAADVRPGGVALDIGSGDGRWPIVAGGLLGLEAHGYESSTDRHELALSALQRLQDDKLLAHEEAGNVHLVNRNFFDANISEVDVFSFYHGSGPAWRYIEDKLLTEGKPGARLILYGDMVSRETPLEFVRNVPIWPPTNIYRIPDRRG